MYRVIVSPGNDQKRETPVKRSRNRGGRKTARCIGDKRHFHAAAFTRLRAFRRSEREQGEKKERRVEAGEGKRERGEREREEVGEARERKRVGAGQRGTVYSVSLDSGV